MPQLHCIDLGLYQATGGLFLQCAVPSPCRKIRCRGSR